MNNLEVSNHPILQHKLTQLRDKSTRPSEFRRLMREISYHMAYECTKDLKSALKSIETPLEKTQGKMIDENLVVVSIFRAGNAMVDGLLEVLDFARVGHIGIYRDKFINNTVEYYFKLPKNVQGSTIVLADPMVATGDTVIAAIDRLKQYDVGPIKFVCLLMSPQAYERISEAHPDVKIFAVSMERELSADKYLLPGMGDAGDRLYGTV